MADDDNWPTPQPEPQSQGLANVLFPLFTFALGIGLTWMYLQSQPAPQPARASASAAQTGADGRDLNQDVALHRQINDQFVSNLRRYHTRLRDIADVAEGEGAPNATQQMRDFALETDLLLKRYDRILERR